MSDSIVRKPSQLTRSQVIDKPADTEFVADLLAAYDRELLNERKAALAVRIAQLLLKGVAFERSEMRRRKPSIENK